MAAAISRRSALAAIGVGFGTLLAACDGSSTPSESTASPGPGRPDEAEVTPSRAADSDILLVALDRARHLAEVSRAITGAEGRHRTLHRETQASLDEQVQVLEDLLRAGDVPVPATPPPSDATPTTRGPADTDTATSTARPGDQSSSTGDQSSSTGDSSQVTVSPADVAVRQLRDLGRLCLEDVTPEALGELTTVSAANLSVLISIAGQRGATAALLDSAPEWEALTGPIGTPAAVMLGAYRPAVYGFEVLAARARGDERTTYEQVLGSLRQMSRQLTQLAGEAAPPAPLGYGLPDALDDTASRDRLARSLMAALPPTIMGPTAGFTGDLASIAGSVQLLAESVRWGQPWNPMTGFPGMLAPGA